MQIQYNITRIEEWCKSHNMPEGTLQLEHLTQATKLLQLKKVGPSIPLCACASAYNLRRRRRQTSRSSTTCAGCSARRRSNACAQTTLSQITRCVPLKQCRITLLRLTGCSAEPDLSRDPTGCRVTRRSERPQRSPSPCARERGCWALRTSIATRGVRVGDVRAGVSECAASAASCCSCRMTTHLLSGSVCLCMSLFTLILRLRAQCVSEGPVVPYLFALLTRSAV